MKRPALTNLQLRDAVRELERLGLSVYGGNVNLKTREVDYGCRDYHASEVLWLRRLVDRGATFWRSCPLCDGAKTIERRRKNKPAQHIKCSECDGEGYFEVHP